MSLMEDKTRPENRASSPVHEVFDRNPDPALEELVRLAAVLSGADYAYIGWMDATRLRFSNAPMDFWPAIRTERQPPASG